MVPDVKISRLQTLLGIPNGLKFCPKCISKIPHAHTQLNHLNHNVDIMEVHTKCELRLSRLMKREREREREDRGGISEENASTCGMRRETGLYTPYGALHARSAS